MTEQFTEEEQLQLLADLVAFKTVNDHETQLTSYVADLLKKHGIESQLVGDNEQRLSLVAEIGDPTVPGLGLAGHADVVHPGNSDDWGSDLFVLTERDGKLYGRGVSDMKSGLASIIVTLIRLHNDDYFHGHVRLLITMNEETQQEGAKFLSSAGYVDDLTGVVLAEPSGVRFDQLDEYLNGGSVHVFGADKEAILADAQNRQQSEQHFITFAHKGFLTYSVEAHGKAVHSSRPASGIDAIEQLVNYYNAEAAYYQQLTQENKILGRTIRGANLFNGGVQPNSIAGEAVLTEMTRVIPEVEPEELIAQLQHLVDEINQTGNGARLELKITNYAKAMLAPRDSKLIQLSQKLAPVAFPAENKLPTVALSSGTDAGSFFGRNPKLAIAIVGPGNDSGHEIDENMDKATFLRAPEFYYQLVKEYFAE